MVRPYNDLALGMQRFGLVYMYRAGRSRAGSRQLQSILMSGFSKLDEESECVEADNAYANRLRLIRVSMRSNNDASEQW